MRRRNDTDREEWVQNDEYLYQSHRQSGQSLRTYVRSNRGQLDHYIDSAIDAGPGQTGMTY